MSDKSRWNRSNPHSQLGADAGDGVGAEASASISSDVASAERVISFSDAVVAIAITLLAIDLPVPIGHDHETFLSSLRANTPEYFAFLISFAVIGIHWVHHHHLFQHVARLTGPLVVLNFGWLLLIVVTPFMTKLLGGHDLSLIRFGMYAITQSLQMMVFAMTAWRLSREALFRVGTPATLGLVSALDALTSAAAFAVSVPVYALIGRWAFACWALVPFLASRLAAAARRARQQAKSN